MNEQMEQMILDAVKDGMMRKDISARYHVSLASIRKVLERYEVRTKQGRRRVMTKVQADECRKLYQEGTELQKLAERYGVSKTTIRVTVGISERCEDIREDWAKDWDETRMRIKKRLIQLEL